MTARIAPTNNRRNSLVSPVRTVRKTKRTMKVERRRSKLDGPSNSLRGSIFLCSLRDCCDCLAQFSRSSLHQHPPSAMVSFVCDGCQQTMKKAKVAQHNY